MLCNPGCRGRAPRTLTTSTSTAATTLYRCVRKLRAGFAMLTAAGLLHGKIRRFCEALTPATYQCHHQLGHPKPAKILHVFGMMGAVKRGFLDQVQRPPLNIQRRWRWRLWSSGAGISSSSEFPRWRLLDSELCTSVEEFVSQGVVTQTVCSSTCGWEGKWLTASSDLANSLGIDPPNASEAEHRRIFHLYLPVFFWLKGLLEATISSAQTRDHKSESPAGARSARRSGIPLVVGVSAPQGCGKTTLVEEMRRMLENAGHPCAVLSIDDFYLTRKEQDTLAARHPGNPLLQVRGNAGTHDLDLGLETIRALKQQQQQPAKKLAKEDVDDGNSDGDDDDAGEEIKVVACIPRYNKSAGEGRGDRTPREDWVEVSTPPELVLLEGWMLGFEALPEDSPVLAQADRGEGAEVGLREVNRFLRDYRQLHEEVQAWLVLKTADPEMVFEWRAEAERKMRESGRPGMSEEEVNDFCSRYMPAYRAYLPALYEAMEQGRSPGREAVGHSGKEEGSSRESVGDGIVGMQGGAVSDGNRALVIEVGRDRNPLL